MIDVETSVGTARVQLQPAGSAQGRARARPRRGRRRPGARPRGGHARGGRARARRRARRAALPRARPALAAARAAARHGLDGGRRAPARGGARAGCRSSPAGARPARGWPAAPRARSARSACSASRSRSSRRAAARAAWPSWRRSRCPSSSSRASTTASGSRPPAPAPHGRRRPGRPRAEEGHGGRRSGRPRLAARALRGRLRPSTRALPSGDEPADHLAPLDRPRRLDRREDGRHRRRQGRLGAGGALWARSSTAPSTGRSCTGERVTSAAEAKRRLAGDEDAEAKASEIQRVVVLAVPVVRRLVRGARFTRVPWVMVASSALSVGIAVRTGIRELRVLSSLVAHRLEEATGEPPEPALVKKLAIELEPAPEAQPRRRLRARRRRADAEVGARRRLRPQHLEACREGLRGSGEARRGRPRGALGRPALTGRAQVRPEVAELEAGALDVAVGAGRPVGDLLARLGHDTSQPSSRCPADARCEHRRLRAPAAELGQRRRAAEPARAAGGEEEAAACSARRRRTRRSTTSRRGPGRPRTTEPCSPAGRSRRRRWRPRPRRRSRPTSSRRRSVGGSGTASAGRSNFAHGVVADVAARREAGLEVGRLRAGRELDEERDPREEALDVVEQLVGRGLVEAEAEHAVQLPRSPARRRSARRRRRRPRARRARAPGRGRAVPRRRGRGARRARRTRSRSAAARDLLVPVAPQARVRLPEGPACSYRSASSRSAASRSRLDSRTQVSSSSSRARRGPLVQPLAQLRQVLAHVA